MKSGEPRRAFLGRRLSDLSDRAARTAWLLLKRLHQRARGDAPELTVFVGGAQRSGTNMIMNVLERSLQTDVYHEHDPRAFSKYRMRPVSEIQELWARSRASHFVIKALLDLDKLPFLMRTFAPSKTLWLLRDFEDVVNSMCVSFSNQAQQIRRVAADRTSEAWLAQGMSDETHALLRDLVDDDLNNASGAALLWYMRNVLFFEMGFHEDPAVKLVSYEDLVTAPEQRFPEIFQFLGLKYSGRITKRIYSSSIRKRAPLPLKGSVRRVCEQLSADLRALA